MEITENVKNLRKSLGLTQNEFSAKFHIPIRTIQDWESGRRTPPEYVLELLEYRISKEKQNQ